MEAKAYVTSPGNIAATFTYDANGDRLTGTTDPGIGLAVEANHTWDFVGRLLAVTKPYPAVTNSTMVTFAYDGLGLRVSLTPQIYNGTTWVSNGNVEYYIWDGDQIVQKRTSGTDSANISAIYYNNGYQTVSSGSATGNYYYTKDHLGSIREVLGTDGNGHPVLEGRYSYGPWGETIYMDYSGGSVAEPQFGYDGYFQTPYLPGLYLTEYRAYEPASRAWLSRDPLGEAGALNLYGYVQNDPVNFWDPLGLATPGGDITASGLVDIPQFGNKPASQNSPPDVTQQVNNPQPFNLFGFSPQVTYPPMLGASKPAATDPLAVAGSGLQWLKGLNNLQFAGCTLNFGGTPVIGGKGLNVSRTIDIPFLGPVNGTVGIGVRGFPSISDLSNGRFGNPHPVVGFSIGFKD